MKLKILVAALCTVGSPVSQGMEFIEGNNPQKIPSSIQHIPQDVTVGIFHFADYPTLARSRQVCKNWKTLIDEKLPLPQRYTLKYLAQFVQKNNPERTIERFKEIFLAPLSSGPIGKTALDDIIDELQEDLSGTKEQAYQALLSSQLISTCPSIELEVYVGGKLEAQRKLAFPYIPENLVKHNIEHLVDQHIKLVITPHEKNPIQIFGIANLPASILDRVIEVCLDKINLIKIPRQFQKLQRLTHLNLTYNQLSNIPAEIRQLINLQTLTLSNNRLSGIPAEIGQLTNLQKLFLRNNQLSSIPVEIRQLTKLQVLSLDNNLLSSIPGEIGQLTNLQTLYLHNNQLSSIPAEISQLANLQELNLSNNQLNSIPAETGQLTKLKWLHLPDNQLSSISAEIRQLTNLQRLYLQDNQLSSIPAEIGQLTNLQMLYLYNNQLSSIPAEIGQLTNLQGLELTNNQLNSIPSEVRRLKARITLQGNPVDKICTIS